MTDKGDHDARDGESHCGVHPDRFDQLSTLVTRSSGPLQP
jgi:hypothetical protein